MMKIYKFNFKAIQIIAESQEEAEEKLSDNLDKLEITDIEESDVLGIELV